MTADREIDYETLAQNAMRGIVRTVLTRVAKTGLPGEHHFYIAFKTDIPGVSLSDRLREKYPEEMTVVLQHRFWDLIVSDDRFEVNLTFDSIPERLVVPFSAIKVFFDPSVPYGLQFDGSDLAGEGAGAAEPAHAEGVQGQGDQHAVPRHIEEPKAAGAPAGKARNARKLRGDLADEEAEVPSAADGAAEQGAPMRLQAMRPKLVKPTPDQPANDSKVVQLDKFRKR
jgi:hypothetical protein